MDYRNERDERDKWGIRVNTGLDTSLSYFGTMGRMGHLHF